MAHYFLYIPSYFPTVAIIQAFSFLILVENAHQSIYVKKCVAVKVCK